MKFTARMALLLVAAFMAALVVTGVSSAAGVAPQAAACEKHKKDEGGCHGEGGDKNKDKCPFGMANGSGTSSLAGAPFNQFDFTLCRTGPTTSDVTGYFAARVPATAGAVAPQGPVTCAAFDGKTVSFLYPFNEKSSPPDPMGLNAILIVATDGGPNPADDKIGFFMGPTATFANNCDFSTPQAQFARNVSALPLLDGNIAVVPATKS